MGVLPEPAGAEGGGENCGTGKLQSFDLRQVFPRHFGHPAAGNGKNSNNRQRRVI